MNSSSIYSMYLQHPQAKNYGSLSNRPTVKAGNETADQNSLIVPLTEIVNKHLRTICPISSLSIVYGKPILPTSSTSPSPVPFLQGGGGGGVKAGEEDVTDRGKGENSDGQILPPPNVDNIPRPLSPTKLTPVGRYQSIIISVLS